MKHAGLETGDVVGLSSQVRSAHLDFCRFMIQLQTARRVSAHILLQEKPYIVCQEEDAGAVCFIFRPAEDHVSQAAPLEVVRQVYLLQPHAWSKILVLQAKDCICVLDVVITAVKQGA